METCVSSGPAVFGAMLGVAFAAQGMSQLANSIEALSLRARLRCLGFTFLSPHLN
jgi:hypothetical protein